MEGDGMVAIVQGLKDAGLAVTLMNKTHLQNSLRPPPVQCRSSVETSTNVERVGRTTAVQVRDDHYTSSYQLAHCNIRPSSPPERLPEFPPQRLEPSRNEGNFQVGGYGSGEYHFSPPPPQYGFAPSYYGMQGYRGGVAWPERGISGRLSPTSLPSQAQGTDPFVHSLRRYPLPPSPERSVSAELVQRLLSYTQNKHLSKNSNRNISREENPASDSKDTSTKNIQTYTRSKNEPTKDSGAYTYNDTRRGFGKKGRSFSSTSPYNARAKREHHNDSYDYLRTPSRHARHPEVRYLNDVRRCIRDTIKQIYVDKPLVCPQINSRYTQHKKEHHQNSQDSCPDAQCREAHASTSTSNEMQLFARCQPPTESQITSAKQQMCSCGSGASTKELSPTPEVSHESREAQPTTNTCTCKAGPKSGNKIADEIHNWLNDLPVYANDSPENKTKREEMIEDLADKLKSLEGEKNYEQKAKDDIKKCIEKLPIWYPGAKRDQETFKNQIANDLFSRLSNVHDTSSDELKDAIALWIDEIPFEKGARVDKDDIVENLVDRLKPLVDKPDEMKSEIEEVLQELPIKNKSKMIKKLANGLINDLEDITKDKRLSTDSTDEELERKIMDWLEDIPELSSNTKENKMMVKSLAKKLKKTQKQGWDSEENEEQIKEEVIDWIDSILKDKGEKLDTKTKAKLSDKLLDELTSTAKFKFKKQDRKSSLGETNDYETEVWEWLDDVIDDKDKKTHKNLINKFAEKLQELKSENADDEVMEEEIMDFLESLSKKGVALSSNNKGKLAKNLMNKIEKATPRRKSSLDEDLQQSILSEISDLVEDIPSNINKNKRKEIKDKLANILARNVNNLSDKNDNINREIVNILEKEAKMPENEATNLATALINRVNGMPLPKSNISRQSINTDSQIKQLVSEEVSDILNDYNISGKKRKEVKKSIIEVLADQIVRGTDNEQTKENLVSILQHANVSEEDALNISDRLLEKNKELSLSYKTQDSKLGISKFRLSGARSMSPMEREDYEEKVEGEILDFIEDITGDGSPKTRKKRKEAAEELVHRLGEIMSNPDETDKENSIFKEVSQFFRNLSIDSDIPRDEMARKLANRLQGIGFQVSTPKKGAYSFQPKRGSMNISSIYIDDEESTQTFKKPVQILSDEEKKYANELTELIESWMDDLSVDLSGTGDKGYRETMIQDLASDIIDRQKYLQLNPNAKTSDQEELEHLKYQVFRWLNKLLDTDDMSSVMQKTDTLMRKIKDVNVPQLVESKRFEIKSKGDSRPPDEYLKANLEDWMNSLPITGLDSTEKAQFEKLKKEFTERVKEIRHDEPNNEQKLKDEIRSYLLKFPIEEQMKQNNQFINNQVEQLYKSLLAVPNETVLEYGSDEFIKKAINNWVNLLPLDKGKAVSDIPSNAITDLASAISNLLVKTDIIEIGDIKNIIEEETKKFLKRVPLDPSVNIDVKNLADVLWKDVKEMSRKRSSVAKPTSLKKAADVLFDNIESWCNDLPLKQNTPEEIEISKKIKQELATKLIHIVGELNMNPEVFNDDFLYDEMLEDEIDNLLTDISSEDVRNNMPAIKNNLMEKVKEARQKTQDEVAGQAYKQQLREVISKTLPSQSLTDEEQASFEVVKDNLADAFINLHYVGDNEELKNKYKTKINDEVNKFCNDYLKKHPATPIDSKKLNHDLYNALRGVPVPKEETIRNEVELVKVKDEVQDWLKELPLKEQTAAEKVQTNKVVAVLAKKLHDIEKQKELVPDADYDDKMRKEITKLIKKLPLSIDDAEAAKLTDKLINNLKSSEKSRRVSASTRHSIEADTEIAPHACEPTCKAPCRSYTAPPSRLSFEDREHLQKIRERSPSPRFRCSQSKDASVSPLPIDAGSQTEIRPWDFCKASCGKKLAQQSSGVQTHRPADQKTVQAVGSQVEVIPHVIVKEYYWDSVDAAKMHGVCPPCPSQFPTLGFPLGTPQVVERPVSQQPSANQSKGPCSQCPHVSPRSSRPSPFEMPTPQPRKPRREWEQPCYMREMPEVSSEEHPETGTSRSFRAPRVTRLGSFDDMAPKCSRSKQDWTKFPDDEFWGDKRKFASDEDDGPFVRERKKEEEKVSCRCRERILTKCVGRKGRSCHSCQPNDNMKRCAKCCGVHCPYPSYLYFRQ